MDGEGEDVAVSRRKMESMCTKGRGEGKGRWAKTLTTHCWFTVEGMEGEGEVVAASRREGHSEEAAWQRLDRGGVCNDAAVVSLPSGAWGEREKSLST
jgi:hypothetical protein